MVVEEDENEKLAPDLPEWPERERLRKEKDALGLYLTGHPINEYEEEVNQIRSMKLSDLAEEDPNQKNGFLDKLGSLIPEEGVSECPILINYETDEATAQLRLGPAYKAPLDNVSLGALREYLGKEQVVINF